MRKLSKTILIIAVGFNLCVLSAMIYKLNHQYYEYQTILNEQTSTIAELEGYLIDKQIEINRLQDLNFEELTIEDKFHIAADEYDLDFKLLYAIAIHETGNFTSPLFVNKNNPGGLRGNEGWMSFPSQMEGIMAMARIIRRGYWDQGLTDVYSMESKYCPDSSSWALKVSRIMNSIED